MCKQTIVYRSEKQRKLFINGVAVSGVNMMSLANTPDEDVAKIFEAGMKFRTEEVLILLEKEEEVRNAIQ